jgi:hypothetical protein
MSLEAYFESTADSRAALRADAAANLTNIDAAERADRTKAGVGMTVLTLAVAATLLSLGVTGLARWPIFFPTYFAVGASPWCCVPHGVLVIPNFVT